MSVGRCGASALMTLPEADRVAGGGEHNRDRRVGGFCRECGRRAGGRNDGHAATYQVGDHLGQPLVMAVRPAKLDRDVLAFNEAH